MSFKWPNKDPDEILDYSIDWSRWLGVATITNVTWYIDDAAGVKTAFTAGVVVNGLQNISQTATNTVATIILGSGTANVEYKLYCRMIDDAGLIAERVVKLRVKEQ